MKLLKLLILLFFGTTLQAQPVMNCSNWLSTPSQPSLVTIGDLDIPGNQVTVEATFNRLSNFSNGVSTESDLVSKHTDPSNANYLLRPTRALITTTNGFFVTPDVCPIQLNKTYHVAMVYDGSTLKFYRNGFLMSQIAATGNMIQNDFQTAIGLLSAQSLNENFIGFINEVRIWNVARSQSQLRSFMSGSLPTPSTQPGLLAYYTFDNLFNKQGNPAWNGTLVGSASINAVNTACSFIADSCAVPQINLCNTTLSTPANGSYASVGDLDVSGTSLTVEATINRTTPYLPGTGDGNDGDIVSKHLGPPNTNYLLRPNHAYITTSNGFFATPDVCDIELNKTYHLAMVYDGSSLKFYRNGFLMSQIAATGTLFQNDYPTRIGMYTGVTSETFIGYTNEVRIWDVARTQSQIRNFMSIPLPNPPTQPGLQAYYTFDNLINKQGNPLWNATLSGAASINQVNPQCPFIFDSCVVVPLPRTSYTINDYSPVASLDICQNNVLLTDAAKFKVGDTVLLIQMNGSAMDTTNSPNFGTITNYNNAGNYEFNYVKAKTGNLLTLLNRVTKNYDVASAKIQLVRVPYFINTRVTDTLTCLPWDGQKGGVLVFNVQDTLELKNNIDVSGKGFLPGNGVNLIAATPACSENNYYYANNVPLQASTKGTGIAIVQNSKAAGKGSAANGGGGGNSNKTGGGGGGNGSNGGMGGYQYESCGAGVDNRGIGGKSLIYSNVFNQVFMGGSGGSGHANNGSGFVSNGGAGGGIIIIKSRFIKSNSFKIVSNGADGHGCIGTFIDCHNGMGGGGAGGAVVTDFTTFLDNTIVEVKGGNGANMSAAGVLRAGPGGGGGGGVSWIKQTILPAQLTVLNSGGLNGVCTSYANDPYGATAGQNGLTMLNVVTPTASTLFKPNIDSVRFSASTSACNLFNFSGLGYTNSKPITSWQWNFGDGANASTQNASHFYTGLQTYTVKLVVTDVNGCKDSITKSVTTTGVSVDAGLDTVYCSSGLVTRVLKGTGVGSYSWSPSQFLNNSSLQNPTASVASTTKFYLALTNAAGCTGIDSVTVVVNPLPVIKSISDTSICIGAPLALTTSGASAYSWTSSASVDNSFGANPLFIGNVSQQVIVTGTANSGCSNRDTVMISVKPIPKVQTIKDSLVCSNKSIILASNGAQTYHWTPAIGLDNPNISNPVFAGNAGNQYIVTGILNGCVGMDTVNITVRLRNSLNSPTNGEFCIRKSVVLDGNNGNTYVSYAWSPSTSLSSNNIINPIATPSATTNYTLTVTDKVCNYDSIFTVRVTVNPLPDIEATKSNDITCALGSARLTATGGISYSWTPAASLNDASTATPTASPTSNTIYTVIGTNVKGCSNADTVTVYYKSELGGYNMPNTFTPNGDGTNECFGVAKWGEIRQLDFIVYDRWGTRIFETHNPNVCWDGRYKGVRADQGTYVFYVRAMLACGEITRKGNVLLIR